MEIREDVSAARDWLTMMGGGMWSAGVGGSITGRGGNILIIDDPLANAEEAFSQTIRTKTIQWWESTFYTRLEPNGAIIIVMTRWHMSDLVGYLLEKEAKQPEHWHIVNFPAIKEDTGLKFPDTCTVSPDWRKTGEALCPERYDEDALAKIKGQSTMFWISLYQQRPSLEEGNIWKRGWFKTFEQLNGVQLHDVGTDWDLAYTKEDQNSASAYMEAGVDQKGNIYITDLDFQWLEYPEMIKWIKQRKAPHYVEAKATGKSAVQSLKNEKIAADEVEVSGGDKIARTKLATPAVETGKVFIKRSLLERLLDDPRQGLVHFPNASHTDVNDVFVQTLNRLYKKDGVTMQAMKQTGLAPSAASRISGF
jgi:phage terminase large subunit-like protein